MSPKVEHESFCLGINHCKLHFHEIMMYKTLWYSLYTIIYILARSMTGKLQTSDRKNLGWYTFQSKLLPSSMRPTKPGAKAVKTSKHNAPSRVFTKPHDPSTPVFTHGRVNNWAWVGMRTLLTWHMNDKLMIRRIDWWAVIGCDELLTCHFSKA